MPFCSDDWDAAVPWEVFLGSVREKADVWQSAWRRASLTDVDRARLRALPASRRVLVLAEDWCGDAARSVPVLARAVEAAPGSELRVLDTETHVALVDLHLSRGARAVPVAILQDESGGDLGWWGPRPAPLQTLLRERLAELGPPAKEDLGSFYAPIMGWYRKDAGRTTLDEFLLLLERGGGAPC